MRAFRIAAAFLLIALCGSSRWVAGQTNAGLHEPVRENDYRRQVDAIFAGYDHPDSPGCAAGIVRDGEFVYKRGYGMGSIELAVPLSPESVFYMHPEMTLDLLSAMNAFDSAKCAIELMLEDATKKRSQIPNGFF
jgi:hypothetical protein